MLPEVVAPKIAVLAIEYILLRFLVKYQIGDEVVAALLYLRIILRGTAANGTFPIVSIFQSIFPTKR